MTIKIIPKPRKDTLVFHLYSLYEIFKDLSEDEKVEFDISQIDWVPPLLVLPISAYCNTTASKCDVSEALKIKSYLDTISFPVGLDSVSEFQRILQYKKTFIPIGVLKRDAGVAREKLETLFSDLISKSLKAIQGTRSALIFPISELVTNIFEHSKTEKGFIFGQFYPKKDYLEICIVDRGRGLASSYFEELKRKLSDEEAIINAVQGNSTKQGKERGYGIRTSKRLVCEALGGQFILVSGGASLVSDGNIQKLVTMPNFNWRGVIISYRIPKPKKPIDITPYIE